MPDITSTRNARVREVVALHRARDRRASRRHLVEGPHAVAEAARAGLVDEVFVTEDLRHELTLPDTVTVSTVRDHVMERLSDAASQQGVVAVARTPHADLMAVTGEGLLVVLFEVADPGNVGTIVRTADAAGARGVVATAGSADVFSPKAVRAAAGSTYHLPIVVGAGTADVLARCRASGQQLVALDGRAQTTVFELARPNGPIALVLGNEAHGLPAALVESVDQVAAVPILGAAESLNVAAAAAVAIYAAACGLHRSS